MPLTIFARDDDDETDERDEPTDEREGGPYFRVFLDLPEWAERLRDKLIDLWIGAQKG